MPNIPLSILSQIRVASPCSMRWEDMAGDDRTRFCKGCKLHVHNLSAMSGAEAEALVARTVGQGERLCGVFYRRPDGTVLTQDCPVGIAAVKARVRRRVARIAAAMGLLATGGIAAATSHEASRLRGFRPFSVLAAWLAPAQPPPPPGPVIMGEIACPVAQPAPAPSPVPATDQ